MATEWRPFTVPNLITLVRLLCIPIFLWLLFGRDDRLGASLLLGTLGATDWVDGWFARRYGQVSELGKILDPVADRLLLGTAIIAILIDGSMPLWVALLILTREILVSIAGLVLAALGARRIDVTFAGKTATFFNMISFPGFLAAESGVWWDGIALVAAWGCAAIGIVVGWYALFDYVPRGREALREGRADRAERAG
ncbi:MAG: CDP-alcohol phosphatidyltransferase family protein [Actinomycetota bacterium]